MNVSNDFSLILNSSQAISTRSTNLCEQIAILASIPKLLQAAAIDGCCSTLPV